MALAQLEAEQRAKTIDPSSGIGNSGGDDNGLVVRRALCPERVQAQPTPTPLKALASLELMSVSFHHHRRRARLSLALSSSTLCGGSADGSIPGGGVSHLRLSRGRSEPVGGSACQSPNGIDDQTARIVLEKAAALAGQPVGLFVSF